jgi:ketosteroid isomerase-like protein
LKRSVLLLSVFALCGVVAAQPAEPDHEIHEQLRVVLRDVQGAINSGQYDRMLPLLAADVEATSITQEVMSNRGDVSAYFKEWFGPSGYMRRMDMKLDADKMTELSADRSWGLVRGKGLEHYEAKDGDQFDFVTRWTAVLVREPDDQWRLRAIHFGTNHLDNPVLTKVSRTLIRNGIYAAVACLIAGLAIGWTAARWRRRAPAA